MTYMTSEDLLLSMLVLHRSAYPETDVSSRYKLDRAAITNNIETRFLWSAQRIRTLSYALNWSQTLKKSKRKPDNLVRRKEQIIFHDLRTMPPNEVKAENEGLANWIVSQVIRDLNEYISYHILQVHDMCARLPDADKYLTSQDIQNALLKSREFETRGLADGLKILRKEFGIKFQNQRMLINLYKMRNLFAHFDGIVQRKYCDAKGTFKTRWLANKRYLVRRRTGKRVLYSKVSGPISGKEYSQMQTEWLARVEERTYKLGDKIELDIKDVSDLVFFHMCVLNELQVSTIKFMKSQGFLVREFDAYGAKLESSLIYELD